MYDLIIAGGGAAGMLSSIGAAKAYIEQGVKDYRIVIIEKNEKLGKKLFITGKGRCNITNACDIEDLFRAVKSNPKFLYSAFYTFSNESMVELLNEFGLDTKVERGNRVFPVSDHSSDVIKTLKKALDKYKIEVILNTEVKGIICDDGVISGVMLGNKRLESKSVIIATGGYSYSSTGSTGDGYKWAKTMGHKIVDVTPSLVPFETYGDVAEKLMGLSLKNVDVRLYNGDKVIYKDRGEMLFTHFGLSGPLILTASAELKEKDQEAIKAGQLYLSIDLKPALNEKQLDERLIRDFDKMSKKEFKNSLNELLPAKLIPVIVELSGIDPYKKAGVITKDERRKILSLLKNFRFKIKSLRGFDEAIITKGGVDVKGIDPGTMESKLVKGLYFAGEVIDLDAVTGGFNLQIAWSTGYLAGYSTVFDK